MIATVLWAILRPLLPYVLVAVALTGTITGFYFKVRHDEKVRIIAQIEKEKTNAINNANAARDRVKTLCQSQPANCTPDDEFRD